MNSTRFYLCLLLDPNALLTTGALATTPRPSRPAPVNYSATVTNFVPLADEDIEPANHRADDEEGNLLIYCTVTAFPNSPA
jgi:hypothetical protein